MKSFVLTGVLFFSLTGVGLATIPAGMCGENHACPSRAAGYLSLRDGQHAVNSELASEDLPASAAAHVTGCWRVNRSEVKCGMAIGPVTYTPVGCAPGYPCAPPQTVESQTAELFARRIGHHRVLVWYGPGKPKGINYIYKT